jgi:hypothetical protein
MITGIALPADVADLQAENAHLLRFTFVVAAYIQVRSTPQDFSRPCTDFSDLRMVLQNRL